MVLVGYQSSDNKVKVWEKVDWMICYFDCKHFSQRLLLPAIHQFSEPEQ